MRSCFAKRFLKVLQLLQRSHFFRGARARTIFEGARAQPNTPLLMDHWPRHARIEWRDVFLQLGQIKVGNVTLRLFLILLSNQSQIKNMQNTI
jgi:hypothetical protein